ncbi:MAG: hypothetical protein K2X77_17820 [Candidatus Obscuribacterales bacterium]|nr:hypothetical protein [Candidatus Obscuribacterales bacterium]
MIKFSKRTDKSSFKLLATFASISAIVAFQPAHCSENSPESTNAMPVKLYGKADVMVSACEIVGLTMQSKQFPTSVTYVRPLSAAAEAGIRMRDLVLNANVERNILYLTVVRRGNKKFGSGMRQEPILAETLQYELTDKGPRKITKGQDPTTDKFSSSRKELLARKSSRPIGEEDITLQDPEGQQVIQKAPGELPVNQLQRYSDPLKAFPDGNIFRQIGDAIQSKLFGRTVAPEGNSPAEIVPDPDHKKDKHPGKINPDPRKIEWRIGEEIHPDPHKKQPRKSNPPNPDPKAPKWHKYDEQPNPDPKDPKWHKYEEQPNPDPKDPKWHKYDETPKPDPKTKNPRNRTHEKIPRVVSSPWSPTPPKSRPRIPREPGTPPPELPPNPKPAPPSEGTPWAPTPIDGGGGGSNPGSSNSGEGGPALACPATTAIEAAKSFPEGAWANDSTIPGGVFKHENGKVTNPTSQTMIAPMKWPFDLPGFQTTGGTGAIKGIKDQMAEEHKKGEYTPTASDTADMVSRAASATTAALAQPNQWLQVAKETANVQTQQNADNSADMTKHEAGCALDFCRTALENFTVNAGNKWNVIRDRLFMPMAILLLLPGAIATQAKATVAQSFPLFGEVSPIEGIYRSIVAIFLIPGTYLIVNYGIDVSNSIAFTISSEYSRIFGSDMYRDAMCAQIRAYPARLPGENLGYIPGQAGKMQGKGQGPRAKFEGKNLDVKLEDPCAGLYEAPMNKANEKVPYVVNAQRAGYNGMGAALAMTWNILCAFQMCYLYYLWFVGPVVAALWVYPVKQLREAFPNWCEGVVTICFWSLFWNTTILLMACCRGIDDTGTVIMSALNFLSTACVKFAFDFAGLVKAAGAEVGKMAEKAAAAGKGGGGKGGGAGSGKGGGASGAGKSGAGGGSHGSGSTGGGSRGGSAGGHGNAGGGAHPQSPPIGTGGQNAPSIESPPSTGRGQTVIAGSNGQSDPASGIATLNGSTTTGGANSGSSRSLAGFPKFASIGDGLALTGLGGSIAGDAGSASASADSTSRTSISNTKAAMGRTTGLDISAPQTQQSGGAAAVNQRLGLNDELPKIDQTGSQNSGRGGLNGTANWTRRMALVSGTIDETNSGGGSSQNDGGAPGGTRSSTSASYGRDSVPNYTPVDLSSNYTPVGPTRNYTSASLSYPKAAADLANTEPISVPSQTSPLRSPSMPRSSVPSDFNSQIDSSVSYERAAESAPKTMPKSYRDVIASIEMNDSELAPKRQLAYKNHPDHLAPKPYQTEMQVNSQMSSSWSVRKELDFLSKLDDVSTAETATRIDAEAGHSIDCTNAVDPISAESAGLGDCRGDKQSELNKRSPAKKTSKDLALPSIALIDNGQENIEHKTLSPEFVDEKVKLHKGKSTKIDSASGAPTDKQIESFFDRLQYACMLRKGRSIAPMSEEELSLMKKLGSIVESVEASSHPTQQKVGEKERIVL